jgi:hypothetical protein
MDVLKMMVANTQYATRTTVLLASLAGGVLLPDKAHALETQTYLCLPSNTLELAVKHICAGRQACKMSLSQVLFLYKRLNKDDIDACVIRHIHNLMELSSFLAVLTERSRKEKMCDHHHRAAAACAWENAC